MINGDDRAVSCWAHVETASGTGSPSAVDSHEPVSQVAEGDQPKNTPVFGLAIEAPLIGRADTRRLAGREFADHQAIKYLGTNG